MYDSSFKLKAIELFEDSDLDVQDVYETLVSDHGFSGTYQIVKVWINNKDDIKKKYLNDATESRDQKDIDDDDDDDNVTLFDSDDEYDDKFDKNHSIPEVVSLRRSRQNLMDQNRILRKMFREQDRVINATNALLKDLLDAAKRREAVPFAAHTIDDDGVTRAGLIQLADLHLNEAVLSVDTKGKNTFDFHIASKRLQKYAYRLKTILRAYGVTKVVLALTGDMFNSNRRKDEILRNLKALAEGFLIGADIIASFIQDLAQDFEIEIISVFGNESRLDEEIQSIDFHNNFDYLLHHYLQPILATQKNVMFHPVVTDHELLININNAQILLWHGHNRASIDKLIVKYAKMDEIVHYVVTGHKHHLILKEESGQSGSLVGDNAYSFQRLNVASRASQTFYVIEDGDGKRPDLLPHPVDLQNVDRFDGYPVPENASEFSLRRSLIKGVGGQTILRIVV
ncbi:hypothetical protein [Acinetobacter sp.]|uniref:hypothetical protein n=1 Tax=Acinetobacter sp. TaxID=472 RepID=UPI003D087BE1